MAVLRSFGIGGDPPLNHNFLISLIDSSSSLALATAMTAIFDVALGGFSECTGVEMSLKLEEHREGGNNGTVLKFPTRVEWANITLKKGIGAGTALWDWHYDFAQGKGKRKDGLIVLLTDLQIPNNIWYFRRGLPVKYTSGPMNASQNQVAIESIEIAHEGVYQVPGIGYGAAAIGFAAGLAVP